MKESTPHQSNYYLYAVPSPSSRFHQFNASSSSSRPSSSSSLSLAPLMLSVVYPQTMYVAGNQQQQYYYVQQPHAQPAAGQWAVPVHHQSSAPQTYVYATQGHRTQHSAPSASPVYQVAVPQQQMQQMQQVQQVQQVRTAQPNSMALVRPGTTSQVVVPTSSSVVGGYSLQAQPTSNGLVRPPLQRKASSVSFRRGSFDSDGVSVNSDDWTPVSPVLSDTTSSSSSSGSSVASHLNLPRSALSHYTAPQRSRRRESIVGRRPEMERAQTMPLGLPAPQQLIPQHTVAVPQYAQAPVVQGQHAPTRYQSVPRSTVLPRRASTLDGRPVSFHEEQTGTYSSYELYQPASHRSHPPVRPSFTRKASSRSLSASVPDLNASSYGAGFGMGAGPGISLGYGSADEMDSKKPWWKLSR